MQITLTLSEPVVAQLQRKATQLNVSFEDFAEKIFRDAAVRQSVAINPFIDNQESHPTPEEVVAMIKAAPPNPNAIQPATQTVDELLADLAANPPEPSDISPDEWDRLWAKFEQELKDIDRANDIAEGRL
jgi:hypothetical protein